MNTKDFYHYRIISGINEFDSKQLLVYPNPASDFLNIDYGIENEFNVEIASLNGCSVISQRNFTSSNVIDVSKLSSGIYILSIIDGNTKINKIVIIK
ncbi:MAG: T9SS type A sorting domain-containing protein [Bacteroidales bacterium]|nr:T9SS type A sorting domain-containing protein [Bacteroidales bacterium]